MLDYCLYLVNPTSEFRTFDYILYLARRDYPEEHDTLDKEFDRVIRKNLSKRLGKKWEEVLKNPEIKKSISFVNYYLPTSELVRKYGKSGSLDTYYITKDLYPVVSDFTNGFGKKDVTKLSELMLEISAIRRKISGDLRSSGVITGPDYGYMWVPDTLGKLKSIAPEVFDWWVEELIKKYNLSRVIVVSEEDDLKKLREWIPEVMI